MSIWRGDGRQRLGEAIREKDLSRKVQLLVEANLLLYQELEWIFANLGPENFSRLGLKEVRGEK